MECQEVLWIEANPFSNISDRTSNKLETNNYFTFKYFRNSYLLCLHLVDISLPNIALQCQAQGMLEAIP